MTKMLETTTTNRFGIEYGQVLKLERFLRKFGWTGIGSKDDVTKLAYGSDTFSHNDPKLRDYGISWHVRNKFDIPTIKHCISAHDELYGPRMLKKFDLLFGDKN